ncbi:MAG: hypothetical protein HQM04_07365 [Magnetococcales bacterium]|nr:hypothetical protein [Magnetococcales bacterium]MBF0114849.1 hypothetical protein [Magnetococcales bacterium]
MLPSRRSELSTSLSAHSTNQQNLGFPREDALAIAELLSRLALLERSLCQIADGSAAELLLDPLFRSMSDMYRRSAAAGLVDFSDLAYELAQAFGTARADDSATRRLARLALLAVGQMRRLLIPRSQEESGLFAKQVVQELVNCWA